MKERTFVLIKPDGVKRRLIGDILQQFESCELSIIGLKMLIPEKAMLEKHYPEDDNWFREVGIKTKAAYEKSGKDVAKDFTDLEEIVIGKIVKKYMVEYLTHMLHENDHQLILCQFFHNF